MEQLGRKQAENEADKIREMVGGNPSAQTYEIADKLNDSKMKDNSEQLSTQNTDAQLVELKRKLAEAGDQVLLEPEKKFPRTLDEFFEALAPDSATGSSLELIREGKADLTKWFLSKEGLSLRERFKKRTRDEGEIVGQLLARGAAKDAESARRWIAELCKNPFYFGWIEAKIERVRNGEGTWVYRLLKKRQDGGD